MNEVPTLTECKKKFKIYIRDMLTSIKMLLKLIRSTSCAREGEGNQIYRKDVKEVLQKTISLAKIKKRDHAAFPA